MLSWFNSKNAASLNSVDEYYHADTNESTNKILKPILKFENQQQLQQQPSDNDNDDSDKTTTTHIESLRSKVNEYLDDHDYEDVIPEEIETWKKEEREFTDDSCLKRYLRAENNNVTLAAERIISTLKWRREFQPHRIDLDDMKQECQAGKVYLNGFSKSGNPLLYMITRREGPGPKDHERGLKWSIFLVEKAISIMPKGVEKLVIIIDYENANKATKTPMSITRRWIDILKSHYPERLAIGFMLNPTMVISIFLRVIRPFLDPVTREKIKLVDVETAKSTKNITTTSDDIDSDDSKGDEDVKTSEEGLWGGYTNLSLYIDHHMLDSAYGGGFNFAFNPEVYWKALISE